MEPNLNPRKTRNSRHLLSSRVRAMPKVVKAGRKREEAEGSRMMMTIKRNQRNSMLRISLK